ncbi:hypothetical protein [Salisediminibacterium selenitireducens]|uniref:Uncharacterized protein n=1 Tax=Bacillus selenitireducens (strain ATCC 700615 / DSM 15326 / MLS10) TaxID=439292 RepID=D6XZU2_BACIE|nr:hypothetical protein [Salisediminibacterium selenitireducens]ADI00444.1 hypothetical protein Bsel_2958 [[Bacillus] selenitireducens MLS10]
MQITQLSKKELVLAAIGYLAIPIAVLYGLDAWVNFLSNNGVTWSMIIFPFFASVAIICISTFAKERKKRKHTSQLS